MNFISISTTQVSASLSYFRNDENIVNFDISRQLTPSKWLNQSLEFLEKNYNDFFESLNYIAVDIGPGSFTGIKVGLSFAQGIALSKGIFIVPVSSCETIAYFGLKGFKIATITNAHRNLYYFAIYERKEDDILNIYNISSVDSDTVVKEMLKHNRDELCIITEGDILDKFAPLAKFNLTIAKNLSYGVGQLSKKYRVKFNRVPPESIEPLFIRQPDIKLKNIN
ncbi:MAG: tRNA (adenosine(37)-N6)-threonylcarbamoyltransferase complex dimerization subunit type 1 TsaB [Proteobacteria bacterium]|nr:tRNA (adenosine(37)-N6)-threonylcarbamoyltransferase complex dimerization subunit type 1 TsaB [Pseudomonadota bacterium]